MPQKPPGIFREPGDRQTPKPPKPPRQRSKLSKLRKIAAAQRKKQKMEARRRRMAAVKHISKKAVEITAEQIFGEGGLTPARHEAMSAVLVGPENGLVPVTSVSALKVLVRKARQRFIENADRYMKTHVEVVEKAFNTGELDLAARHAEWALDRMADDGERVTDPPSKSTTVQTSPPQTLNVGVALGGMPQKK